MDNTKTPLTRVFLFMYTTSVDVCSYFQTTRLGRMVNELRKNTADRDLARRAKNLVRQWQELLSQSTSTSSSPQSRTASPALHSLAATAGKSGQSNGAQQPLESSHPKVVSSSSSLLRVRSSGYIAGVDPGGLRLIYLY